MGSEEQFVSFILHSVLLYPFVSYLLAPHPTRRWLGVILAVIVMSAFAYFTLFYGQEQPNYYEILGVSRDVSGSALKKAFKRISLVYHPDKNRAAADTYEVFKAAYDVLGDADLRRAYDIGGLSAVEAMTHTTIDSKYFILQILMHLCFSGFSTFIISSGEPSGTAMKLGLTLLFVICALEIAVCVLQYPVFPIWFLPSWTPFDILHVLRRLYPTLLNACRCFASAFYVSRDVFWMQAVTRLVAKQAEHHTARQATISRILQIFSQQKAPESDRGVGIAEQAMQLVESDPADGVWDIRQVHPTMWADSRNSFRWHVQAWLGFVAMYFLARVLVDEFIYQRNNL